MDSYKDDLVRSLNAILSSIKNSDMKWDDEIEDIEIAEMYIEDAISCINDFSPRILTAGEVQDELRLFLKDGIYYIDPDLKCLDFYDFVWDGKVATFGFSCDVEELIHLIDRYNLSFDTYGKLWRCWTCELEDIPGSMGIEGFDDSEIYERDSDYLELMRERYHSTPELPNDEFWRSISESDKTLKEVGENE